MCTQGKRLGRSNSNRVRMLSHRATETKDHEDNSEAASSNRAGVRRLRSSLEISNGDPDCAFDSEASDASNMKRLRPASEIFDEDLHSSTASQDPTQPNISDTALSPQQDEPDSVSIYDPLSKIFEQYPGLDYVSFVIAHAIGTLHFKARPLTSNVDPRRRV